ncbi:MAG: hypothetical protein R3F11_17915 [Verrucomicrobiales bacterium]
MMNEEPQTSAAWRKVASAAVKAGAADPAVADDSAPFGFATRTAAGWKAQRRAEALSMWRRWSLCGAACSVALLGIAVLVAKPSSSKPADQPPAVFSAPDVEVPVLR